MEKRYGSILTALLLAAGLAFHSPSGHQEASAPTKTDAAGSHAGKTSPTPGSDQESEGPWLASSQYWEALRLAGPNGGTKGKATESDEIAIQWGLPENFGPLPANSTHAHAVIATVPDPVHSHLAPEFDRTLDALIGAASDNGYLASYSWLPWKTKTDEEATEKPTGIELDEPGLLIFDRRSATTSTPPTLYMFLVAEMPGDGVNSRQLKKALTYELQLRSGFGNNFASDPEGKLRVIGPQYSGSARSLIETINAALKGFGGDQQSGPTPPQEVEIVGGTETEQARRILNRCSLQEDKPCVPHGDRQYVSFASSAAIKGLQNLVEQSGYDAGRTLELREDGTFFGTSFGQATGKQPQMPTVSFPRDISLLRNSHKEEQSGSQSGETSTPTPYLHLTTHDQGSQDTLPEFSTDVTPLSQEAQLMSISHGLTQLHADFAYIAASNPMDTLFLAKSLHRSNPDTRLVMEPDLLLQREGDDAAFIGSLSVTPYPLVWAARSAEAPGQLRTFATAAMEAYYNAASFTLGSMAKGETSYEKYGDKGFVPILYGYNRISRAGKQEGPPLWLTAVGADGYYPIAMLTIDSKLPPEPQKKNEQTRIIYPSHVWQAVCVLIALGCVLHIVALFSATYASPQTCDLDIQQNCMRHRRALYGQVGGGVLFLMGAVAAIPAAVFLHYGRALRLDYVDIGLGVFVLLLGIIAWVVAFSKTVGAVQWDGGTPATLFNLSEKRLCAVLYWGAIAAVFALVGMWFVLCKQSPALMNLGAFFSYRCLHPLSGVSPIAPALLLLWGWFLWALLHARRLRLTPRSRPRLPDKDNLQNMPCASNALPDLFVSDTRLRSGLLEDTTCLMISRRVLQRIFPKQHAIWLDRLFMLIIAVLTGIWIGFCPVRSLEHLGVRLGPTALYELFIGLLLVPLLVIVMCAAARLFLVAASLRNQLLERLERMPLRNAFTRLQGFHWVGMLRESGQLERWRDMARSTEGIRQILNDPGLPAACRASDLHKQKDALEAEVRLLDDHVEALHDGLPPPNPAKQACQYVEEIEKRYAVCAESILCCILLPHWTRRRHDLMQSLQEPPRPTAEPNVVLLAEEFLAMRYVALIRAILAQMRYLLTFITAALVLIMLALNAYPFQPKQEIDWFVTGFFLFFSAGIVIVFAQMHRNPLLSRITDKDAHELGLDFYLRVATFGALPLITWLATQYPSIGSMIYGVLKPGLDVMK